LPGLDVPPAGLGVPRVEPDDLGAVGNGLAAVAFVPVGDAPAVVRLGVLRVQPDGLAVVGNGLILLALAGVGTKRNVLGGRLSPSALPTARPGCRTARPITG
jgi:hypothetical protein